MATLDLDAARAARAAKAEAQSEPHTIVLGGQDFTIPAEMPAEFAFLAMEDNMRGALQVLLNGQYEKFAEQRYSVEDLYALMTGISDLYGFETPGEALASRRSSSTTGKRSRPTSKATTD